MNQKYKTRQMMAGMLTGLLSPVIWLAVPAGAAAGRQGWLCPLLAGVLILGAALLYGQIMKDRREGEGLYQVMEVNIGRVLSAVVGLAYVLWFLSMSCASAVYFSEAFVAGTYRSGASSVYVFGMGVLLAAAALGKKESFFRTAPILFFFMAVTVILLCATAIGEVNGQYLLPIRGIGSRDWMQLLRGALRCGAAVSMVTALPFLGAYLPKDKGKGKSIVLWTLCLCAAASLLTLVSIGINTAQITALSENPLYLLTDSIGVKGGGSRGDRLVVCVWVMSQFAYGGFGVLASGEIMRGVLRLKSSAIPSVVCAAAATAVGMTEKNLPLVERYEQLAAPWTDLILCLAVPLAIYFVVLFKRKKLLQKP